jgi:hypothetical protein
MYVSFKTDFPSKLLNDYHLKKEVNILSAN